MEFAPGAIGTHREAESNHLGRGVPFKNGHFELMHSEMKLTSSVPLSLA
jgi:hypothetical protein